jgi:hypothetical protein
VSSPCHQRSVRARGHIEGDRAVDAGQEQGITLKSNRCRRYINGICPVPS